MLIREQAEKEGRAGPSACPELVLEEDGLTLPGWSPLPPLDGGLSKPGPKWRGGQGVGTALDRKEKKKSFLVTYFPKLLLAPVPPAWTTPLPPPQHPS